MYKRYLYFRTSIENRKENRSQERKISGENMKICSAASVGTKASNFTSLEILRHETRARSFGTTSGLSWLEKALCPTVSIGQPQPYSLRCLVLPVCDVGFPLGSRGFCEPFSQLVLKTTVSLEAYRPQDLDLNVGCIRASRPRDI